MSTDFLEIVQSFDGTSEQRPKPQGSFNWAEEVGISKQTNSQIDAKSNDSEPQAVQNAPDGNSNKSMKLAELHRKYRKITDLMCNIAMTLDHSAHQASNAMNNSWGGTGFICGGESENIRQAGGATGWEDDGWNAGSTGDTWGEAAPPSRKDEPAAPPAPQRTKEELAGTYAGMWVRVPLLVNTTHLTCF